MVETCLIAIVDDDAPLLTALGNLIRSAGYRAALFERADEYLAFVAGMDVDLVLSDHQMPDGSGAELIEALRKRGHDAPVIIMTAQPFQEVAAAVMTAGAFAVLSKPFDEDDLLEIMEAALRRIPTSSGAPV